MMSRSSCGWRLQAGAPRTAEITRVRERLSGLYGARASLDCIELHGDTTQLTMRIPADDASRAR